MCLCTYFYPIKYTNILYECLIDRYRLSLTYNIYLATLEMAYFLASCSYLFIIIKILFSSFLDLLILVLLEFDIVGDVVDFFHEELILIWEGEDVLL